MAIGFERYLTKPLDFHDLLRLVDCCVRRAAGYA
jgi:DNA-binding response OmpR family regulator